MKIYSVDHPYHVNPENTYLLRLLSAKAGCDVTTPHGAERLRNDIQKETGERLSVNTVKRLTGVIPYEGHPRLSTLEILARYLGFPTLEALRGAAEGNISGFSIPENFIDASALATGALLRMEWAPDRRIAVRHLGEGSYEIVEAENSKLRRGDILALGYVAEGYPLMVREVRRGEDNMGPYTAAADGGLTKVEIDG